MVVPEGSPKPALDPQASLLAAQRPIHRLPALEDTEGEGTRGSTDGTGLRIAIACSRFNGQVTSLLLEAALAELDRCQVTEAQRTVVRVPGAFELPLAAMALARSGDYDAIVCVGAVIRGETSHYDFVAGQCAAGIQRVQLDTGLPVAFGLLTTENLQQALDRAGGDRGNKGTEAAATAIEMANVLRYLASIGNAVSLAARGEATGRAT
jgi:6,7-dimethyl-8-ribityllumazine synthase